MASGTLKKKHRGGAPIVDINMIPLIDVSLVLLIIFMVLTPSLVQQQLKINLPRSVTSAESPDKPIVITLQQYGELSLNGRSIATASLEGELKSLLARNAERAILIQADKNLPLQNVVSVMDIAKRLNVSKLGISVEQPNK